MEIGPIFRALINNRSRFWLITIEIALTLAIVTNCINMIMDERETMLRPTGMDVDRLIVVYSEPWAEEFQDDDFVEASFEDDLRVLRAIPGVYRAAGISATPLSGGGSATGRRATGSEEDTRTTPYFVGSTDIVETLGVELVAGRNLTLSDYPEEEDAGGDADTAPEAESEPDRRNVLVTQALADRFYPDGGALGKTVENTSGDSVETIVGIISRMHGSWPLSPVAEDVMIYAGVPAGSRHTTYLVRVEEGRFDEVYTSIEEALTAANGGRIVTLEPLAEIKAGTYRSIAAVVQLLTGLSVLLVIVTTLGIVGITSFSVTQRTREIGTRRALGATRLGILRYFLVENWVMTGVGLVLGLLITYGLNFLLAHFADVAKMQFAYVAGGMLMLWAVGQLAALMPALRGMGVAPVVATRNV